MIKLQDFARENGVTDRAIQKHLKTYAAELEGLFERNGPNGTWLSEEACDFLRSKMKRAPIVVSDGEISRKLNALETENKDLLAELKDVYKEMAELKGAQARLEAAEASQKLLEESRDEYKAQAEKQAQEAAEASQKAAEAAQRAQEMEILLKAAEEEKNALKADFEAYKSLPWYKKFLNKG